MQKKSISIVVPCYNEEPTIKPFYEEIAKVIKRNSTYKFEIIFINDGSKDNTIDEMKKVAAADDCVAVLDFSRNFGKEAGLLAGLEYASGDAVIVMDVDLQDPPALIDEFIEHWAAGKDIVYARRSNRRGEPVIRSFFARMFYKLINRFSEVEIVDGARDFRIMDRKVIDSILELKERNRFSKGLFMWVGYDAHLIEFEHVERVAGETSWNFWGLFAYAIEGIVSFSTFPLRIAGIVGALVSFLAFVFMGYIVVKAMFYGNAVDGWASMTSIMLFMGGLQLLFLGVIGEYLSRIFTEVKGRPSYMLKECINSELNKNHIQKG